LQLKKIMATIVVSIPFREKKSGMTEAMPDICEEF